MKYISLSYKYLDATFYIHTFQATFSTFLIRTLFLMNFIVNYFNVLQFQGSLKGVLVLKSTEDDGVMGKGIACLSICLTFS